MSGRFRFRFLNNLTYFNERIDAMSNHKTCKLYRTYNDFDYTVMNNYIQLVRYNGGGAVVKIPDTIEGKPVTIIEPKCFKKNSVLEEVEFPNQLTSIEANAFEACVHLRTLSFPKTLRNIGKFGFYGCSSLQEVILPEGVRSLGEGSFAKCKSLKRVVFPSSITLIEQCAFFGCPSLQKAMFPSSNKWVLFNKYSPILTYFQQENGVNVDAFINCKSSVKLGIYYQGVEILYGANLLKFYFEKKQVHFPVIPQ